MEFTVHSIKDIESWLEIHRTTGMDIDLHFHIKRSPDIPGEDSLIDMPFKIPGEKNRLTGLRRKKPADTFGKKMLLQKKIHPMVLIT